MIRVGLVGFGMAGRVFHGPLLSSVDGLELAAVIELCDHHSPTAKDRRALAALLDRLPEALNTPAAGKARALLRKTQSA